MARCSVSLILLFVTLHLYPGNSQFPQQSVIDTTSSGCFPGQSRENLGPDRLRAVPPLGGPTSGRLRRLWESVYPKIRLAPLGDSPAEVIALAVEATLRVAFIAESVAFRLAPESFYSVRSRGGLQMSLGLRTGDRASASANRYRVSLPLRERRTPTSLALAPAGEPVGLVSSDPPICSALPSVQNQPVAVSARPTPEPNTAGPRTAKHRPCASVGSDSGARPRLKHRKLAFGVTACPLGPERRTLS